LKVEGGELVVASAAWRWVLLSTLAAKKIAT